MSIFQDEALKQQLLNIDLSPYSCAPDPAGSTSVSNPVPNGTPLVHVTLKIHSLFDCNKLKNIHIYIYIKIREQLQLKTERRERKILSIGTSDIYSLMYDMFLFRCMKCLGMSLSSLVCICLVPCACREVLRGSCAAWITGTCASPPSCDTVCT